MSLRPTVKKKAKIYGLDPKLVAAIVYQESRGNIYATRYEPNFKRRYLDGKSKERLRGYWPKQIPTYDTEIMLRATSFGPMQVMGQVAREYGFEGQYLTELCSADVGIGIGCFYLASLYNRAKRKEIVGESATRYALAKYNGSMAYADIILGHIESGAYEGI